MQILLQAQGFGNQMDQYELLRKLGDGAFSRVMLARHRKTQEYFAIKMSPIANIDERIRMYIAKEIDLQSNCKNCPNVVRFKEQFTSDIGYHCIVMECMPGGDL